MHFHAPTATTQDAISLLVKNLRMNYNFWINLQSRQTDTYINQNKKYCRLKSFTFEYNKIRSSDCSSKLANRQDRTNLIHYITKLVSTIVFIIQAQSAQYKG